jgi:outer membrane biosynthesis protein TonB
MTLKLALVRANSYYFCGKVTLAVKNTENNPVSVEFDSLNDQEVIGLVRAIKTNVIKAVEGEDTLLSLFKEINVKRKFKKETPVEVQEVVPEVNEPEVVVEAEPVVEEEKTSEKEEETVEDEKEEVKEDVKVAPKTTPKKTTTTRKTTQK